MMAPEGGTEILPMDLTEIVGDLEIPCDWASISFHRGEAARWIVFLSPCVCGRAGERLICGTCKDVSTVTEDCAICGHCGEVYQPFRRVIHKITPLEKR